jgi:putative nucleotidyltransferase with HDIG domain
LKVTYTTKSPEDTIELGKALAHRLKPGNVVLLYGDLGTGKTHFIKGIASGLGIAVTIKSPTYAYINRYPIGNDQSPMTVRLRSQSSANDQLSRKSQVSSFKYLFHYDLYRFDEGADVSSIGFEESLEDVNAVNVVEWADRLGKKVPEKHITVSITGSGNKRSVSIEFLSPTMLSESEILKYYEEWATPMHVREHSKMVTKVAMQIAKAYVDKGEIINLNLLYPACMLHDMNRVCDFRTLNRDRFEEEVTDAKWNKWESLRNEFKGQHHAEIAAKILSERGFTDTAELIRLHRSDYIVKQPDAFDSIEKKIIYYADKRVKHKEVVSLAERFRDGRERYGKFDTSEEKKLFEEVELRTKKLEKELFKSLGIKPDEIR